MNRILERLYLGDWKDAVNCKLKKEMNIKVHINVAKEITVKECGDIEYYHLKLMDGNPFYSEIIKECTSLIKLKRDKNRILLSCAAGVSRSPAMMLCYMHETGWDINQALDWMRHIRPLVNPNPVILESIRKYYKIDIIKELEILRG